MKIYYLLPLFLLLLTVFFSGCVNQGGGGGGGIFPPSKPYINEISLDKTYLSSGETFRIGFKVKNPTDVGFTGGIEYRYNTQCFTLKSEIKDVEVQIKSEQAYFSDFVLGNYNIDKCIGVQQITIVLNDAQKNIMDFKTVSINFVR
jgi:hypothetical protein